MAEDIVEKMPLNLVDGSGNFLVSDLEAFGAKHKFSDLKQQYQIVAIMGPQSSGKSTLLNHLVKGYIACATLLLTAGAISLTRHTSMQTQFGTSFVMMDAMSGRSQTTKVGILQRTV